MSDRARDVVRYIKAIEDTGGYASEWRGNGFGGQTALPTHDRLRAEMLDHAYEPDQQILAGIKAAGIVAPPIEQIRARIDRYR